MKLLLIILYNFLIISSLLAQVGHGGTPIIKPVFNLEKVISRVQEMNALPTMVQQLAANPITPKGEALRFAHPFFVELTPENSGEWTTIDDGTRIWRLGIRSKGAYSINIIFDRFTLAPGASVYIFDPMQSLILGALTHLNNQPTGNLAIAPIPGEELIIELHIPPGVIKKSTLMIGAVNHDYLNILNNLKVGYFGDSGSCNEDLSCLNSNLWNEVGNSVCKIIVDGTVLCSGTLVNNTNNDGKPYFLTAAHCLTKANSPSTVVFYFNYQVSNCEKNIEGVKTQTLSGSTQRAYAELIDIALLEMSSMPPAIYRPIWAGWSRTKTPAAPVVSIHHPQGDVKKISESLEAPISATHYNSSPSGNPFLANSHWHVEKWQIGTTEPGSSGGGLFDNEGLLIGSLSGGEAYCGNSFDDYFARFEKAWNHYPEIDKQLAYWLDPTGTSPQSILSLDFYNGLGKRLSNFVKEDDAILKRLSSGSGVWSGHNSLNIKSIGEEYTAIKSATIHGVYLVSAKSVAGSNRTINIKVWNGSPENSVLLASKNNISLNQLAAQRENLVMLSSPVETNGSFWIEVELNYAAPIDSFAVYQSAPLGTRTINTALIKNTEDQWLKLNEYDPGNYPTSFWIDVLATNVQVLDSSIVDPIANKLLLFPNPVCDQLNMKLDKSGSSIVEVYNMVGQKILTQNIYFFQGEADINLSMINKGLHIIKVTIDGQIFIEKILMDCSSN